MTAISVVIPTIGRLELLEACVRSVAACAPAADEIIVVDQSGGARVADIVRRVGGPHARTVPSAERGISAATNLGLRSACHEDVLVTHDDCTVATDWVSVARALARAHRGDILTGRVLAGGPPGAHVPSTKTSMEPTSHQGTPRYELLYPNNMLVPRTTVLGLGGFDPRLSPAAEDNDLCYRWLRAGRRIRYRPELTVTHHHWRPEESLRRLYYGYGRGQGAFYAKHLRSGDLTMLRYLGGDVIYALRTLRSGRITGESHGYLAGAIVGLIGGWRRFP